MKMSIQFHAAAAILACAMSLAYAYDPSPLQDFCVAISDTDSYSAVFVNGKFCKNPKLVRDEDFFFSGLSIAGNTSNPVGSIVTFATVEQFPGLNTLGIALVRIDYALNGLNPPHSHPRASEFFLVLEGTIYAAFVTSNPEHRLFSKVLNPGDVFLIPQGLIHFQLNVGKCNAVAIAGFNGQFPGVVTIADTVFGSKPLINPDVLAKAFRLDRKVIEYLQAQFGNSQKIMSIPAIINQDH